MPGFSKKMQRKQDTATKTQEAMDLANVIGQYNMANRTDDDVRGTFQGLGPGEKSGFAKGLFAERGAQDPLATEIGRQAGGVGGLDILAFTPADFRRLGGKPGFKFRGLTQYAMIERAFLACYEMPEETQEQIDAKRSAYSGLQEMCRDWRDKHNLSEGGSGDESEARKGHAVMRLYVHTQAKLRQLSFLKRSAPSEAEMIKEQVRTAYRRDFEAPQMNVARKGLGDNAGLLTDSHEQNMGVLSRLMDNELRSIGTDAQTNKPIAGSDQMRGSMQAYHALKLTVGQEANDHVLNSCFPIVFRYMTYWQRNQNNADKITIRDESDIGQIMKPEEIIPCVNESIIAMFTNIPDKVVDGVIAVIRGMQNFKLVNSTNKEALDLTMFASDTLMLRLFMPAFHAVVTNTRIACNEHNDTSVLGITAAIINQVMQRLSNGQTGHKLAADNAVIRGAHPTFLAMNASFANTVRARLQ